MALNPSGGSENALLVGGRYEVNPQQPIPELDCGPATAYAATEVRGTARNVYALMSDPQLPPRFDIVPTVRRIDHNNLVRVLDWGVIDWPQDGRRRPAVIVERPGGPKVMSTLADQIEPFREEPLTRRVIQPFAQVLTELKYQGLAHRNIQPDNLFFDGNDRERAPIMLGEGVSAPAGFVQHAAYAPIECCLAEPAGRGEGDESHDLYAFGVTLAALLIGQSPLFGLSDEEIAQRKIMQGSYAALVGSHRLPLPLMEVLKGLLNDDAAERWALEDLDMWIGGRRLSPKQQVLPAKSSRPLEINGESYVTARDVAAGLGKHWDIALTVVEDGTLDNWLRRSLSDESRTEVVSAARAEADNSSTDKADQGLAKVCIALDPLGPIRMRNFSAGLDGIGPLLSARFADPAAVEQFTKIIDANLPAYWMNLCLKPKPEYFRHASSFERVRSYIENPLMGQGVERALYDLNPTTPCRSPLLETNFVVNLDQLLPALEHIAVSNPGILGNVVDTHIAAFIASRVKATLASEFRALHNPEDAFDAALAATRVLSVVQDSNAMEPAPALCGYLEKLLQPGVDQYHNRTRRSEILENLRAASTSGSFGKLLATIDNYEDRTNDEYEYRASVGLFEETITQLRQVAYEREHRAVYTNELGGQVASLVSGVAATVAILVIILMKLF